MYEMAKKAREAMRGKAKRLSGEKDQKTDSSNWSPAEPLNADAKTGMRPISPRAYKKGGKVEGAKEVPHAGRKPRKSGGRALSADSLINRNVKEANEERPGKKHIGGLKTGGRAGKALGGAPTDMLKGVRAQTMGFNKGGRACKADGGFDYSYTGANTVTEDKSPKKAVPTPPRRPSEPDYDTGSRTGAGAVTRTARKSGGNVNYGPAEMPAGKKAPSTSQQIAEEKREQGMSKPKRGKAQHYADGGAPLPITVSGPDPRMSMVNKNALNFGVGASGSPYKKGGAAKHEDVAEDKALIKKMVKPEARTGKAEGGEKFIQKAIKKPGALHKEMGIPQGEKIPAKKLEKAAEKGGKLGQRARFAETLRKINRPNKFYGGGLVLPNMGPCKPTGLATGGKAKGKTDINIVINPGPKGGDQASMMPPGAPTRPPGGVPVPMGMPPGGAPAAPAPAAPMPMPMPMPAAPMGRKTGGRAMSYKDMTAGAGSGEGRLQKTEIAEHKRGARKAGGKVYRTYKDMDAGAGSGLGRLEKTEIQKRKA